MALGPVSYIIVGFPGNEFNGNIAPELQKLVQSGQVRILDLVFVSKDALGNVATYEFDQLDELAGFGDIDAEVGGLANPDDLAYAASQLEPNSSAALLIWEDAWAAPFAEAVRASGGVLLESARIPYEIIETAMSELNAAL